MNPKLSLDFAEFNTKEAHAVIRTCLFLFLWTVIPSASVWGQLDTEHWIPPFHARYDRSQHYLYLTTPEQVPFDVTVTDGSGNPIQDAAGNTISTISISNAVPKSIYLGNGETPQDALITLTKANQLNQPLNNKGIRVKASKPFYANFRARSNDQADLLTAKGQVAKGLSFRIGHVYNEIVPTPNWNRRSNFAGLMATEDGTQVQISGYDNGMTWMSGSGDFSPPSTIQITLNKGQSYVISTYVDITRPSQNRNGLQGALITATAPIVVNCGSWLGAPFTDGLQDIGFDQIVPIASVGREYILIRGDGPNELETPLVIATEDDTDIFLNGSPTPVTQLDAGELYRVPPGSYTANQNMYIRSGKPVYLFQMLGGANYKQTGGLNFVPPLGCAEGGSVNNIMDINKIGNTTYEGKLLILAETGKTVSINGNVVSPAQFQPVTGKPEFMTYKAPNLSGNVRVDSDGPLQVGVLGRNNNAGWAGYFSGFDVIYPPEVAISLATDCRDTLFLEDVDKADSIRWYRDGVPLFLKTDTFLSPVLPGTYFVIARREFCDELLWDTSEVIVIPQPLQPLITVTPSTCPGKGNGSIRIDTIVGGYPPFLFSADGGTSFSTPSTLDYLEAGSLELLFMDSLGCLFPWKVDIPLKAAYPVVEIDIPDTLDCLTGAISLTAEGSSSGPDFLFQWSTLDGQPLASTGSPAVEVMEPGMYVLSVLQLSSGCSQEDTITVTANLTPPSVQWSDPPPITCRDSTTQIIACGGFPPYFTYLWTGPDTMVSGMDSSLTVHQPGPYTLLLTDTRNGCTREYQTEVVENKKLPELEIVSPGMLDCRNDTVLVSIKDFSHRPLTSQWTLPDGTAGLAGDGSQLSASTPGIYSIEVTDTINGCRTTVIATVGIDTLPPLIQAGPDREITCTDTLLTLNAEAGFCPDCDPLWTNNANAWISDPGSYSTQIRDTGTFLLQVTDPSNGCASMDTVRVTGSPPIVGATIAVGDPTCERPQGSIAFEDIFGGAPPFQFSFDGGQTFGSFHSLDPAPGGSYLMTVKDKHGCTFLDSLVLSEFNPIQLMLDSIQVLEWGESFPLLVNSNLPPESVHSWLWSPPEFLSCVNCPDPIASPNRSITYRVVAMDTFGCTDSIQISFQVRFEAELYIPTAFHPNLNGINDGFTLFGDPSKVKRIVYLAIYDRWGNEVFRGEDMPINETTAGWDGMFRGKPMDPAVCVFSAEVEMANGELRSVSGEIHLIR